MSRTFSATAAALVVAGLVAAAAIARPDAGIQGPYLGSYTGFLSVKDATARGDARLAGKFSLVLRANGTYTASNSFDGPMHGRLTPLPNHRLRFSHDNGCTAGGYERPGGGIYSWSLRGKKLTLRMVSEGACTGRSDTLTFPVWTRTTTPERRAAIAATSSQVPPQLAGTWATSFEGGTQLMTLAGSRFGFISPTSAGLPSTGAVSVSDDTITFYASNRCNGTGTYTWSVSGGVLTFAEAAGSNDPCRRHDVLVSSTWVPGGRAG